MTADMTLERADVSPDALIEGYEAFIGGRFLADHDREELARKGQAPSTMVISCSDSRVTPEANFSAGPGELFELRNVAALAPPLEPDDHHHGAPSAPNDPKYIEKLEFEAIKQTLRNLSAFLLIQVFEHHKRLRSHGVLFRIMNGRLFGLEEATGAFVGLAKKAYCAAFSGSRF